MQRDGLDYMHNQAVALPCDSKYMASCHHRLILEILARLSPALRMLDEGQSDSYHVDPRNMVLGKWILTRAIMVVFIGAHGCVPTTKL